MSYPNLIDMVTDAMASLINSKPQSPSRQEISDVLGIVMAKHQSESAEWRLKFEAVYSAVSQVGPAEAHLTGGQ